MRRLVDTIVGGPPKRSLRASAVWLVIALAFGLLWGYLALGVDGERLETTYFGTFMILGGILILTGDLLYERRRALAQAVRIAGLLSFQAGFLTFIVGLWLAGDYGWFWYSAIVYGLIMVAAVWHMVGKYCSEDAGDRRP